jgi:hypothetical protein
MKVFLMKYWKNGWHHDWVGATPARSNERSSSGQLDRDSHSHPCKKGRAVKRKIFKWPTRSRQPQSSVQKGIKYVIEVLK